ncbi:MAG: ATP-binding protein [Myxococcaceae bacterium]|nr:ATP-binding protein [Myxococcaceae bacterium]
MSVERLDELYRAAVLEHPRDHLLLLDTAGRVLRATRGAEALLRTAGPPDGKHIEELVTSSAPPPEGRLMDRLRAGRGWASAFDPTLPGRGAVWVARPLTDGGLVVGALVVVSAAHVEAPSIDAGALTWSAFEVAQESLVVVDAERRVVLVNEVFRSASARARGRPLAVGDDLLVTAAPGTETDVVDALEAARAGRPVQRRRRVRFPSGEEFLHSVQYRKLDDTGHVLMGAVSIPLAAEPVVSLVSRALDLGPVSLLVCDASSADLPIIYASANLERLTGYSARAILGKNPRLFQGGRGDQPALDVVRRALATGGSCDVVLENVKADQTPFFNRLTLFPLKDELGAVTHYAAFQQDVTELQDLRSIVQQSTLAQTTASLVGAGLHDLRNVLTVAMAGASLALEDVPQDSEAGRALADVVAALQRVGVMARTMLQPLHPPKSAAGRTSVGRLLETVQRVSRYLLPDTVALDVDGEPDAIVVGDEGSLERVLVNLVLNARDAMNGRGHLRLTHRGTAPGRVTIEVRDDGPGLDPLVQRRLFEAYVTTKEDGKGTGLGLASCRRLLEAAGGALRFETGPGGTTWFIELQRAGLDASEVLPSWQHPAQLHGVRVVLVSADLPLRGALAALLRRRGAAVTSRGAVDGEALDQGPVALLVIDGALATERDLDRFLASGPDRRALVLGEKTFERPGFVRFLAKPFDGDAFVREVAALGAPGDGGPVTAPSAARPAGE